MKSNEHCSQVYNSPKNREANEPQTSATRPDPDLSLPLLVRIRRLHKRRPLTMRRNSGIGWLLFLAGVGLGRIFADYKITKREKDWEW